MIKHGFVFITEQGEVTDGFSELPSVMDTSSPDRVFDVVIGFVTNQAGVVVVESDRERGIIWAVSEDTDVSVTFDTEVGDFMYLSDFVEYIAEVDLYIGSECVNMNLYRGTETGLVQVDFLYGDSDTRGEDCAAIINQYTEVDLKFEWDLLARVVPFVEEI